MMERKHKFLIQRLANFVFEAASEMLLLRVKAVAQFLIQRFPQNAKQFLNYFEACLKKVYYKKHVQVEYAGSIDFEALKRALESSKNFESSEIVWEENPELIGGFRLKKEDNILDFSVKAQLNALVNTLK